MSEPFQYPAKPFVRRHGPRGYSNYESYRPWLRDEFSFRCVYCLTREAWARGPAAHHVDHFLPIANHPGSAAIYDNLLYACSTCNAYKRDHIAPDPLQALTEASLELNAEGALIPKSAEAAELIEILRLNDDQAREFRRLWLEIVTLAKLHDPSVYQKLMGFPRTLPNLKSLRPPRGNARQEGISQSYFEKRKRSELPETY